MVFGSRCALAGAASIVAFAILIAALEGSLAAMPATDQGNTVGVNPGTLVNRSHKADRLQPQSDARPTPQIRPVSQPKLPRECLAPSEWHTNIFSAEVAGRCVV